MELDGLLGLEERSFYYRHLDIVHGTYLLLGEGYAMLYGIPYWVYRNATYIPRWHPVEYGFTQGLGLKSRTTILALIAELTEEPVLAEDNDGRLLQGELNRPIFMEPCEPEVWDAYAEAEVNYAKVKAKFQAILKGTTQNAVISAGIRHLPVGVGHCDGRSTKAQAWA